MKYFRFRITLRKIPVTESEIDKYRCLTFICVDDVWLLLFPSYSPWTDQKSGRLLTEWTSPVPCGHYVPTFLKRTSWTGSHIQWLHRFTPGPVTSSPHFDEASHGSWHVVRKPNTMRYWELLRFSVSTVISVKCLFLYFLCLVTHWTSSRVSTTIPPRS